MCTVSRIFEVQSLKHPITIKDCEFTKKHVILNMNLVFYDILLEPQLPETERFFTVLTQFHGVLAIMEKTGPRKLIYF